MGNKKQIKWKGELKTNFVTCIHCMVREFVTLMVQSQ